jgi:hypothetical protein
MQDEAAAHRAVVSFSDQAGQASGDGCMPPRRATYLVPLAQPLPARMGPADPTALPVSR